MIHMTNLYFLAEGDSTYAVVLIRKNFSDPVEAIQDMFDDENIAAFVGFIDLDFAKKTARKSLSMSILSEGFYVYIVRVRFNDLVALYCNKIEKNVQLFGELKELRNKFMVEELCAKLRK